jgi:hypothetical protein
MGALKPAGVQAPVPHRPPKKAVTKKAISLKKSKVPVFQMEIACVYITKYEVYKKTINIPN